jgi:hypothetical protein
MSTLHSLMDPRDQFIQGHDVKVTSRQYEKYVPEMLMTNAGIQKLLNRIYPKWRENDKQKERAGRWARAINLYYRSGMTGRQAAEEMNLSYRYFWDMIKRIRRAADGNRTDGSGCRKRRDK